MQNLHDLQEKIFFETKNILNSLSQIESKDELLSKQDLFGEITDRIAFLRILEVNKDAFISADQPEISTPQSNEILNTDNFNNDEIEHDLAEDDLMEEEVKFTNEINNTNDLETSVEINEISEETLITDVKEELQFSSDLPDDTDFELDPPIEEEIPLIVEQELPNYEELILKKEQEFLESEERRRKIVEFSKEDHTTQSIITEPFEDERQDESLTERKFKLANIKGLKTVQNLFDEDSLDKVLEHESEIVVKPNSGSLLKNNIETDFMEAPKKQLEFKLDFNDKIAFTKYLFNGNDAELKETIDKLNSYDKIDDAQQYLSEIYYKKNWQKVDEYAQRLWSLVENKFL